MSENTCVHCSKSQACCLICPNISYHTPWTISEPPATDQWTMGYERPLDDSIIISATIYQQHHFIQSFIHQHLDDIKSAKTPQVTTTTVPASSLSINSRIDIKSMKILSYLIDELENSELFGELDESNESEQSEKKSCGWRFASQHLPYWFLCGNVHDQNTVSDAWKMGGERGDRRERRESTIHKQEFCWSKGKAQSNLVFSAGDWIWFF